jgi:hypothetical protein
MKKYIDIYLAHRNSTKFFKQQVHLIRKYFKCSNDFLIRIFGYVDGSDENIKNNIKQEWLSIDVIPIDIPRHIKNSDRNVAGPSESFGLAFQYVYENFILTNNNISVCMENDIFPYAEVVLDDYINNYEICGEVRFYTDYLPDRMFMFWLGFIIFNIPIMNDKELWNGEFGTNIINPDSKKQYWMDCGGNSYYWIKKGDRTIKQIKTIGSGDYDGFTSNICIVHNITDDIHNLPFVFRDGYHYSFRVLIYDSLLIHLERAGKDNDLRKKLWWDKCYDKIK